MGFFGTYVYDGDDWADQDPDSTPMLPGPWLMVDIHDGDITTVTYHPPGPGTGVAYLGYTPRVYFENDRASAPTDVAREAAGLAAWWAGQQGDADPARLPAKEGELRSYLATDDEDAELDEDLETITTRFLRALDLPVPADLAEFAG
ncbi:hypothetical protein [Actinophytocola sp.]|uniref:hypothetical protein n=1 Tax=Actinophytocola sp. TaxID=1872138 RepID=UPI002D8097AA|nr:hypothetical protein [Actinophytocola sp.]HET9138494.1 hypothetical protein [Actinophytocola sp.]